MRSIGRRNIELVKNETRRAIREGHHDVRGKVIDWLDSSIFESWEGAYTQISNIIDDTIRE